MKRAVKSSIMTYLDIRRHLKKIKQHWETKSAKLHPNKFGKHAQYTRFHVGMQF